MSLDTAWLRCTFLMAVVTAVVTMPLAASSAGVQIFRADSAAALEDGTLDGVSLSPRGHLQLSRQVTRLTGLEEPFIFDAVGTPDGWIIGTGSDGKVLRLSPDGDVETLATLPEPQVFAVAADAQGNVYAATSPDGKVYRLDDGAVTEMVDPDGVYIWDLQIDADGHLLVATGLPAEALKVEDIGNGRSRVEVLYEAPDVHIRSLLPFSDGLVLGTAGQGLILHRSSDGTVRTLHDAAHPEVVALARADDGVIYAAVLASEASQVDLSAGSTSSKKESEGDTAVTVTETAGDTLGSRSGGFKGARSLVLALHPEGGYDDVAQLKDQTVHSLLLHDGELWIGTGEEGRLFRRQGFGVVEERQLEDKQVVALASGPKGAVAVTANGSAVYGLSPRRVEEGTYISEVLDMDETVRFGSFQWQGEAPKGSAIEMAFRSGSSTSPDATWSDWRSLACGPGCDTAGRLREISLSGLPNGRFLQWRARLEGGRSAAPRLESVELSYRQVNQRPTVEELEVLGPGEILVPSTFNAQSQAYEPWSPNRDSIFTSLQAAGKSESSHLKTLWKRGYRTLKWKVEDGNSDALTYDLHFQPAGTSGEGAWMPVLEDLDKPYVSFDSTVLPDGIYRFRLTASDEKDRPGDEALVAQRETAPVVVDHSPPVWVEGRSVDGGYEVEVRDGLSPLRDAVYSVDAGEWKPVRAVDGLLDGRRENLRLETEGTPRILLLRLTDAAHNVVTLDVLSNTRSKGR